VTPAQRYAFDLRGYVVLPGILSDDEVAVLLAAHADLRLPRPGDDVMEQRVSNLLDTHPAFWSLLDHPVALDVVADLIGSRVRLDHSYAIRMRSRTHGLGVHGGATPFDSGQYYVWRDGRMHNGLCVLAWSLVDAPPGCGGFGCIPGSHKANLPMPWPDAAEHVEEVPMRAGDLLVFTEALSHCTIDWTAEHDRVALLYKYSPGNSAWAASDELDRARRRGNLTETQRRLLQPPSIGPFQPLG
jgi:ectoine hydroxylase-related dioxygenase (phytanoyl-CoA dioxygenase family)